IRWSWSSSEMELHDWRTLHLNERILRESTGEDTHLVLWLLGNRDKKGQEWERISSVPRVQVQIEQGIDAVPATSIRAQQPTPTLLGRLVPRFRESRDRSWTLPNGQSAEQVGERRRDLILIWSLEDDRLNEGWIKSHWPKCQRIQQLGKNLYLVAGVK